MTLLMILKAPLIRSESSPAFDLSFKRPRFRAVLEIVLSIVARRRIFRFSARGCAEEMIGWCMESIGGARLHPGDDGIAAMRGPAGDLFRRFDLSPPGGIRLVCPRACAGVPVPGRLRCRYHLATCISGRATPPSFSRIAELLPWG